VDKFDRFQRFHRILATRRRPIPLVELANELECSSKTAQRTIEQMRDYWQAPIEYSREHRGYYYSDDKFTLPGLWLTTGELQSLTFLLSVVEEIDEGLLHEEVSTVMTRLRTLLAARNIDDAEPARRVRILPLGKRYIPGRTFLAVGAAILSRKRLWIRYCDYQGLTTEREVSPQTLVHYRENWYLDAWCHLRQDLRTFSLSRMLAVELRNEKPLDIDQGKLREHFTRSYGLESLQSFSRGILSVTPYDTTVASLDLEYVRLSRTDPAPSEAIAHSPKRMAPSPAPAGRYPLPRSLPVPGSSPRPYRADRKPAG